MRVAVTGAAGYIGGWLCQELEARGHFVHAQDRRSPGHAESWLTWDTFDLAGKSGRLGWLSDCRPDVVVHLAALYGRVWGEADLIETARSNAGITAALARDVASAGARLMLASSSEVYGASATRGPVDEASPLEPLNAYGLSKKWSEEAARLYAPDGLMVARLNMPYGPPVTDPQPGEVPGTSGRAGPLGYNVLHTMAWQASHGMPITVHKGTERCLTWVGDTVRGLAMIAESGESGTWNVNRDDDHWPVGELARRVVAVAGSSSQVTEQAPPPGVTMAKRLGNARLLTLGWHPQVRLGAGIERTLGHFRRYDENGRWQG